MDPRATFRQPSPLPSCPPTRQSPLRTGLRGLAVAALAFVAALGLLLPGHASAQEVLAIRALTEKRVAQLPAGPLFWRAETFPTLEAARAAEGPLSLVAEAAGRVWLLTLGPRGGATSGATRVAEIGPLPPVRGTNYLIRLNEASGPPGSVTSVHSHPGSEAFYVLSGQQSIRTPTGVITIPAGRSEAGPGGGTPLQVSSTGASDLLALVMFLVDADQAFSSPAMLPPERLALLPRTGATPHAGPAPWAAAAGAALTALGLARRRARKPVAH